MHINAAIFCIISQFKFTKIKFQRSMPFCKNMTFGTVFVLFITFPLFSVTFFLPTALYILNVWFILTLDFPFSTHLIWSLTVMTYWLPSDGTNNYCPVSSHLLHFKYSDIFIFFFAVLGCNYLPSFFSLNV